MRHFYLSSFIVLNAVLLGAAGQSHAQTSVFTYTGGIQTYTVPSCTYFLNVDVQGAQGGSSTNGYAGGKGGRVQATLSVIPGQVLYVNVGGVGSNASYYNPGRPGGYNGGGQGTYYGGAGGGASDIQVSPYGLNNRVVVAGGGAGGAQNCMDLGADAGGTTGNNGNNCGSYSSSSCGAGGTQTGGGAGASSGGATAGSLGQGGTASHGGYFYFGFFGSYYRYYYYPGSGGGGGYYGGGGGQYGSGGGGSSYPVNGATTTYASSVTNTGGFRTGNGQVSITPACNPPGTITGGTSLCLGNTLSLSNPTAGVGPTVTWSSSNPSVATVGATTGIVTGVSTGTTTISYSICNVCGSVATANITVSPPPSAIVGTTSICYGNSSVLSSASGGGTWTSSNPTVAYVSPGTSTVIGLSTGTATITFTTPSGCSTTTGVTVSAVSPITGTASVCAGLSTTLSDATSGGAWSSSGPGTVSIGSSSGIATGVSYGTATISYTVPSSGCYSTLTYSVIPTPAVYTMTGGGTICSGGSGVHIGINHSTVGAVYQLYLGGSPVGTPVVGTSGPVDFGIFTAAGTYTAVANPGTACSANMSGTATISYLTAPTVYTVTGGGGYCIGGTGVHVGLSNSATGFNYQLYVGGIAVGTPVAGLGTSIDFGLFTTTGTYTIVATNPGTGCTSTMSGSAVVSINPPPTAYAVTGGGGYCAGASGVAVGLSSSASGISYQLMRGGIPTGSAVAGTGGTISFGAQTIAGVYSVFATNTVTTCTGNMSGAVTVSVNPVPAVYTLSGGGSFCSGSAGVHVGLSGSVTGITYTLYRGGTSTGISLSGTGSALDFGLFTTVGLYTAVAANATTGCTSNMAGSVTITSNPTPGIYGVTGGGAFCAGGTGVHVGLAGSVLGTTYYLYDGTTLVGGGSGTSAPLDFGLETGAGVYTVVGIIPSTGCSATMSGSVTITVNPLPASFAVTGGGAYCAGGSGLAIGLSSSASGINYRLLNAGVPVGSIVTGSGSSLSFGTFTAPGVYTVLANNTVTGCASNMTGSAAIAVNPLPTPYLVTGGGSLCAGGTGLHVGLTGSDLSTTYQLMNGGGTVGAPLAGTGSVLDFGLQTAGGTYTVVATNAATSCTNNMSGSVTITVNTPPTPYTVAGGGSYCFGGTGYPVTLGNSATGINYQLFRGSVSVGSPVAGTGGVLNFGIQTVAGTYTVLATNPATGCTSPMTGSAIIGVTPLPNVYTVSGGGSYCAGGAGLHVTLSNSNTGVNYQLYNGLTIVGGATAGSGALLDFGAQTAAGSYTVVATDATSGCSNNMTGSANITINSLPAALTVTGGGAYCAGSTGVHIGLLSSVPGVSYQLFNGVSAMGAPLPGTGVALDFGLQTIAGTYSVVGTNTSTGCTSNMTGSATVSVKAAPAIHNVTGGGNYCIGGTGVTVGIDTTNTGVTYQLYLGGTAVGSPVAGTGSALSYGLRTATGLYTVQATNTATGCTNNMAGSANVTSSATPTVYSVTGGGNFCPGGTGVTVGLSGSDPGISYQLYHGTALGSPVTGTGSAINFGLQTLTGAYTVIATGSTITCVATMSGSATVGVSTPPAVYNVTGGGNYCAGGAGVTVGLNTADAGVTYQLYMGGASAGTPVAGTGAALSFGPQTAAGTYTVKATDGTTGCISTMSGSATIIINPLPLVFSVTGGGAYCTGGTGLNIVLGGSETGVNYQLYNGLATVGSPLSGTGATLSFGPQPTGTYAVIATNPLTTCSRNMTGSATVTVHALPVSFAVTGGGAYCSGGAGVHVQLAGSAIGVRYQLYNGTSPAGAPFMGNSMAIDFGLRVASGLYTVAATDTASGCTSTMSGGVTITTNPLPAVYTITGSGTSYCAGGAGVNISLTGSDIGIHYQLYNGLTAVGGAAPGSGGALSFGFQIMAGAYSAIATNPVTGCTSHMTGVATLTINPVPAAFAVTGGGQFCSGGAGLHVNLTGSQSGILYQLYNGAAIAGSPVTGTGAVLDMGLQSTAGNYTVVASDSGTGCSSNMTGSATIVINPSPAAYSMIGGGAYCAGGSGLNVGLLSSGTGVHYQLFRGSTAIGGVVSGTGTAINFGIQTVAGTYTALATNTTTGCSNNMVGSASVFVDPLPNVHMVTGGGAYCAGSPGVHVGLDHADTGISYQLYRGSSTDGSAVTGSGIALDYGVKTLTGTYTVVAKNNTTGCVNNMAGSVTVTSEPLPAVFPVTGGGSYCAGGAGVHVGLASSATGINYTLYSAGAISTLHGTGGPLDFGFQTSAGAYSVTGINAATSCTQNMSGTATIAVNPIVSPSVTITVAGGDTGCAGRMSHFTAVPAGGGPAPSYQWYVNSVPFGTGGYQFNYLPNNGDIVSVVMTSNSHCAVPLTATNSKGIAVTSLERPTVELTNDHGNEVCQGTIVKFTALPSFGGGAPTYTWIKNGVADTIDITDTYSYAPSNGDNIYCVLHSSYHCRLVDTSHSSVITMKTDPVQTPLVVVTASNGGNVLAGEQEILTAAVTNAGASATYQWYVNNIPVPGATLPVFESKFFSDQDNITCKVTSGLPCPGIVGSGSVSVHVWSDAVNQISSGNSDIKLVPNPNKGTFTLKGSIGVTTDQEVTIQITDILGQEVYKNKTTSRGGAINEVIALSSKLANGMYILNLHTESDNRVFHVVIER